MKLWFHKVSRNGNSGLMADDEAGRALLHRLGDGECIQIEATRLRSVQFNKLYWAICREIGENQDPQRDEGFGTCKRCHDWTLGRTSPSPEQRNAADERFARFA